MLNSLIYAPLVFIIILENS